VRSGVPKVESISDHMYRMSLMAMTLPDEMEIGGTKAIIDRHRCIRMCLVHDLAESIVGDITPHCGVSDGDKHAREKVCLGFLRVKTHFN
jgi:putative hydrolase of HD superfamily